MTLVLKRFSTCDLNTTVRNMAGKLLKHILGFTVTVLLTRVCEVKTDDFSETSMTLQFYTDEPVHHVRHRRADVADVGSLADSITEYLVEIELNTSRLSVIDEMRRLQENFVNGNEAVEDIILHDIIVTTVCNLSDTGYQCKCENQHLWSCDKCEEYGSCNKTEDTCSCINAKPNDGQFCQPISEITGIITCAQPPTVPAPTAVYDIVVKMSLRINKTFDTSLTKPDHKNYKVKAEKLMSAIDEGYRSLPYKQGSVKVTGFRAGSTVADYTINATSPDVDFSSANAKISALLSQAEIPLSSNAFAESEENILTTKSQIYPQQNVELSCPYEGTVKWTVNEKDLLQSAKYSVYGSALTVKNASESDRGRYSCIIERDTMSYIRWQNIVIEPHPNIIVYTNEIKFQCENQIVPLTCCANGYPVKWDWIPPGDEVKDSESGCTTLQHKIFSTNCGSNETFTCRLKDMPELEAFDYSQNRIQVHTVREFYCKDEVLGVGTVGESVTGPCDKEQEGHKTYRCQESGWTVIQNECVIKVIKDFERNVEVVFVEEIPAFLANLSHTTKLNNAYISQSAATIQTVVKILAKIASISQAITIDKHVMEDFLKTVDIIVSDNTVTPWEHLNDDRRTRNTSTDLLRAIENFSERLSEHDYMINESSIQLNRTTVENSFIGTSLLPNSATQIVIPNVAQPTLITIIVFTKLDHVLPARNTSNNSGKLENRINGDVVVVKVNQTINNVSFTFDLTNASLGNPQCVFWNFDLNYWDSAGCKVKLSENETDKITCECNHTTSFSILMSPFAVNHLFLDYITYIGVAVSMVSLVLCLIIEMIVWKSIRRNDTAYMRHVSIVNIAVSLLIANICFIIGAAIANPGKHKPVKFCSIVVFFMHFFYLSVFFWMLNFALLLLYRTVMVLSQMSRTKMMVIAFTVGYCAPLLIAVITVALTAGAGTYIWARDACWLNWDESKALLAFVIPALTIVTFNLLVLIVVLCKMLRRGVGASSQPDEKHALKIIVRCVAILTPIFGLTWGFGIGTMVSPNLPIHVVFTILNSFQGLFVLLFGTLLDSKVREAVAGRLSLKNLSSGPTKTTNAGTSSGLGFLDRLRRRNVYNTSDPRTSAATNSSSASK